MLQDIIQNEFLFKLTQIFLLVVGGMLILRFAGRKSIAQSTFPTLLFALAYGTVIIEPLVMKDKEFMTIIVAIMMVGVLYLIEFLQMKFNWFEKVFTGTAIILVDNGQIKRNNLRKARVTFDQVEMYLREKGVSTPNDCESVTLEPNGKIGYKLKKNKQPITNEEFDKKMKNFIEVTNTVNNNSISSANQVNVFDEVKGRKHDHDIDKELE